METGRKRDSVGLGKPTLAVDRKTNHILERFCMTIFYADDLYCFRLLNVIVILVGGQTIWCDHHFKSLTELSAENNPISKKEKTFQRQRWFTVHVYLAARFL